MLDLNISTNNAAFDEGDAPGYAIAHILREIADKLEAGRTGGFCVDQNGNRVGTWVLRA